MGNNRKVKTAETLMVLYIYIYIYIIIFSESGISLFKVEKNLIKQNSEINKGQKPLLSMPKIGYCKKYPIFSCV